MHEVIAQDRGHVCRFDRNGQLLWKTPCPGVAHDLHWLGENRFLTQTNGSNVVEMDSAGRETWRWNARPRAGYAGRVEVHAFQPLGRGRVMIAESGNRRIIEVDRNGRILNETPLLVERPDAHRDTRLVRKLRNGNYLACHEGDGVLREYDTKGNMVWSYRLDLNGQPRTPGHDGHGTEVFGAIRLRSGNTLIAGGNNNRVFEVDKVGRTVWSVERDELVNTDGRKIHLCWVTTLHVLRNGNVVFGNCHAGPDQPQLIEVNRAKRVVWSFTNFEHLGNDTAAAHVLERDFSA